MNNYPIHGPLELEKVINNLGRLKSNQQLN